MASRARPHPAWLLLRGLGREVGHWGSFPDRLRASGQEAFTLDLPGVGLRREESSPISIQGITDNIRDRWLGQKHPGPVGLFAVSLGGMVALDWAARFPSDFSRLVIVNSSCSLSPPFQRLRPASVLDFALAILTISKERREARMFERVCNCDAERMETVALWRRLAEERPLSASSYFRQLLAAARFDPPRAVSLPMLVLASSRDRLVNPACSRVLADLYQAEMAIHPWAGHDLPQDDGSWVAEEMKRFWSKSKKPLGAGC